MAGGLATVQIASTAASASLTTGRNVIKGMTIREVAGTPAAARINIRDGSVSGPILLAINLVASESVRDWFAPDGIRVNTGIYLQVLAGTVEGAIYIG